MPSSFDLESHFSCRRIGGELAAAQQKPFPLPGDKPHYPPDRVADIRHIKLELSVNIEGKSVGGRASITLAPINDGLTSIVFDAVDLSIKGVSLATGEALSYEAGDGKLRVGLGSARPAGQELTVAIDYEAHPRRGLYFVGPDKGYPDKPVQVWSQGEDEDSRHWFPCYDFPNEMATSEMVVTVPERFFALSNGRLLDVSHNEAQKTKTYHWRQDVPHVAYLISLVAGEYVEIADSVDGLPVLYYVPPGREEDARRAFGKTPGMVRFFSEKLGVPYPYAKYAQVTVADFIFGGMENISATTVTDTVLHDERAHLDFSADYLVSHELAHQWFGDLLTCRDWAHGWLNEGFATYFEELYRQHDEGEDEFRYAMHQVAEIYLGEDRGHYRRPLVTNVYNMPMDLFDRHLYEKGGLVLHTLHYVLGDDLFWKAIRHYVEKNRGRSVVSADLQQAIEEATGRSMEAFFEQWVYKAGYPELKVSYQWNDEQKTAQLTISQTQQTNGDTPLFKTPIDVAFVTEQGKETHRIELSEKEQTFYFRPSQKPLLAQFDPGNWVLKTLDITLPKDMLLYQIKSDDDVMGRVRAAQALGKQATPEAVDALKAAVQTDAFWGVQAEAAKALGAIKSERARQALAECLSVQHPKARRAVVTALGQFKVEEAVDALLPVQERDASYFVEAEAVRSIGKTKSARAFDVLQKALRKESFNEVVRAAAFDGFAELKDERAIPLAKEWAAYGRPERARFAAVAALGKLGEEKPDVVDYVIDLLDDPAFRVRLQVVNALRELKDAKAIGPLQRMAERDLDGRTVRMCREAVAAIRQGKTPPDELKKVREDMDKMAEENRKLRDRIERLEARLDSATPAPSS